MAFEIGVCVGAADCGGGRLVETYFWHELQARAALFLLAKAAVSASQTTCIAGKEPIDEWG